MVKAARTATILISKESHDTEIVAGLRDIHARSEDCVADADEFVTAARASWDRGHKKETRRGLERLATAQHPCAPEDVVAAIEIAATAGHAQLVLRLFSR
jgi:hypothetical protein